MKRTTLILMATLFFAAPSTYALDASDFDVRTTGNLVTLCSASENDPMHDAAMGYCYGFVDAAINYHRVVTSGELLSTITCPDHKVTRQELRDAFLAWAGKNESLLDGESPIQGVMRAASAKWPCE